MIKSPLLLMTTTKSLIACLLLLILNACTQTVSNLTPRKIPQNPSNIYTITFEAKPTERNVVNSSLQAFITIDEQTYPMQASPLGPRFFEYEYRLPEGRNSAKYYFTLFYDADGRSDSKTNTKLVREGIKNRTNNAASVERSHSLVSDLFALQLTNRYVITLESKRGFVGSEIPVIGRGFNRSDRITFGGIPLDTTYYSANSLSFNVPPVPSGNSYEVYLESQNGNVFLDYFQVDSSLISVLPNQLDLSSGEFYTIVFSIPFDAPAPGLPLTVTTNIPDSIIMPEVVIEAGQRNARIQIQAGSVGNGKLFVQGPGFSEVIIPLNVR